MQILILGDKDSKQNKRQEHWVLEGGWKLTIRICRSEAIPNSTTHMPHTKHKLLSTISDKQRNLSTN
jgi:hypothetical protein